MKQYFSKQAFRHYLTMPFMTYLWLFLNILIFISMWFFTGSVQSTETLVLFGANYAPLVLFAQQWWRLLTAGFVHIGFEHLLFNSIFLYLFGSEIERIIGHARYSVIYILSIIGGNLLSLAFSSLYSLSAGASSGLFGLFATFIILSKLYPQHLYLQSRGYSITILVITNLVLNLFSSSVDIWGHIGGIIMGSIVTVLLCSPLMQKTVPQKIRHYGVWTLLVIVYVILCLFITWKRFLG